MNPYLVTTALLAGSLLPASGLMAAPASPTLVAPHYNFNIPWIEAPIHGELRLKGGASGQFYLRLESNPSFCGTWAVEGSILSAEGAGCDDPEALITFEGQLTTGGAVIAGKFEMDAPDYRVSGSFAGSAINWPSRR